MRRIRIDRRSRRRRPPQPDDLSLDPRDPDIVRAKAASPDKHRAADIPGHGSDPMTRDERL
jgi:hypothetical protein